MSSYWAQTQLRILRLEKRGLVTRTFRRLDPQRQQAILQAILDEAAEKGPADVNIKQIALRAGVSVGSLYQYFGNRQGLLAFTVEVVVQSVVDLFNSFRPQLAELPLKQALEAYLLGGIEWSKEMAGFTMFFARAAYQGDPQLSKTVVRPIANVMREGVHDILAQAAARGEIRPDADLEATTRVIHALMIAIGDGQLLPHLNAYFQVKGREMPAERILAATLELILCGIGTDKAITAES